MDPFGLSDKYYLITGGTRGIGRAISLRFARAGATVLANYVRNAAAAEELEELAAREGLRIKVCRADITGSKGLETLIQEIQGRGRVLDGWVHCAATGVHKRFDELTPRHVEWVLSLNVRAFIELVRLLLPSLQKGSGIVVLSSQGAVRAVPAYSLVGASKGALEALARHLAAEFAERGIRVNILSPGSVITDAWKAMPDAEARLSETVRRTPLGRLVTVEEVACAAQFLCSDASSGMVGHTLVVDGGAAIVA